MIRLSTLLNEYSYEIDKDVAPVIQAFQNYYTDKNTDFKYLGLKDGEYIYKSEILNLGDLDYVISEAYILARITDKKSYFGLVYLLNGMEQFDATICRVVKKNSEYVVEEFDDKTFNTKETEFAKIIKTMS